VFSNQLTKQSDYPNLGHQIVRTIWLTVKFVLRFYNGSHYLNTRPKPLGPVFEWPFNYGLVQIDLIRYSDGNGINIKLNTFHIRTLSHDLNNRLVQFQMFTVIS
jgi:hypothetical protein